MHITKTWLRGFGSEFIRYVTVTVEPFYTLFRMHYGGANLSHTLNTKFTKRSCSYCNAVHTNACVRPRWCRLPPGRQTQTSADFLMRSFGTCSLEPGVMRSHTICSVFRYVSIAAKRLTANDIDSQLSGYAVWRLTRY